MAAPRNRRVSLGLLALHGTWVLSGCFLFGYDELSPPDKSQHRVGQDGSIFLPVEDAGGLSSGPLDADVPDAGQNDAGQNDAPVDEAFDDGLSGLLPDAGGSGPASPTSCPVPDADCEPMCTAALGACRVDCADAALCVADCQPNTQCLVACSEVRSCGLVCARGSRCALDCSHTNDDDESSCDVSCKAGARCAVDCHESNRCAVSCEARSACAVDCRDSNDCRDVVCADGAACLLYCPNSNCSQATCLGEAKTCRDGTIACGVDCPFPGAWDWDAFVELGSYPF